MKPEQDVGVPGSSGAALTKDSIIQTRKATATFHVSEYVPNNRLNGRGCNGSPGVREERRVWFISRRVAIEEKRTYERPAA